MLQPVFSSILAQLEAEHLRVVAELDDFRCGRITATVLDDPENCGREYDDARTNDQAGGLMPMVSSDSFGMRGSPRAGKGGTPLPIREVSLDGAQRRAQTDTRFQGFQEVRHGNIREDPAWNTTSTAEGSSDYSMPQYPPRGGDHGSGDHSVGTFLARSSTNGEQAGMNWNFYNETSDPEEDSLAAFIARFLQRSRIAKCLGMKGNVAQKVNKYIRQWNELKEPVRERTCVATFTDSAQFQGLCLIVIFANTVFILWSTDADIKRVVREPLEFQAEDVINYRYWIEQSFTLFYSIELLLKLYVHGKFFFLSIEWRWNLFDTLLVAFSIFDGTMTAVIADEASGMGNLTFLRALRILRVARVMRMIRAVRGVQELRLMLDCVLNSAFHLFWCICLILLVLVMFSLLLIQGMTNHMSSLIDDPVSFADQSIAIRGTFDSVSNAMLSLFEATTGGDDWKNLYAIVDSAGSFFKYVFLFYIAFFAIVAWNIVMSTFVEKALKLATPDIDSMVLEKTRKDFQYSNELAKILTQLSGRKGSEKKITLAEFKEHMRNHELQNFFRAREVELKDAELFFHMLASVREGGKDEEHDDEEEAVDIKMFVKGCMRLRGMASNIDVQSLHYDVRKMHARLKKMLVRIAETLHVPGSAVRSTMLSDMSFYPASYLSTPTSTGVTHQHSMPSHGARVAMPGISEVGERKLEISV